MGTQSSRSDQLEICGKDVVGCDEYGVLEDFTGPEVLEWTLGSDFELSVDRC